MIRNSAREAEADERNQMLHRGREGVGEKRRRALQHSTSEHSIDLQIVVAASATNICPFVRHAYPLHVGAARKKKQNKKRPPRTSVSATQCLNVAPPPGAHNKIASQAIAYSRQYALIVAYFSVFLLR